MPQLGCTVSLSLSLSLSQMGRMSEVQKTSEQLLSSLLVKGVTGMAAQKKSLVACSDNGMVTATFMGE